MPQRSQSARKQKDQDHDYDQSQSAAWVVSPRAAIWPCRESPQKHKNQHHQKNRIHLHLRFRIERCSATVSDYFVLGSTALLLF